MNCYNSDKFLKEAIDSIYMQSYSNWEIIFWDNASTDNSARIAKSYDNKLKYYLASETSPIGHARNFALEKASGKYIAFLDCDDMYFPNKLQSQINLLESNQFNMCYGSVSVIRENGSEIKKFFVKNNSGNIFANLLRHYEINMQTVMLRKDYLINNNLTFNSSMAFCPDHNLFMLVALDTEVGVIKDVIAKYRKVDNSLSKKTIDVAADEYRFTLDSIINNNAGLKERYQVEFNSAYNKATYYEVLSDITNNKKKQARLKLKKILTSRIEYFLLYLLLLSPVSNKFLLKILGR